MDAFMVQLNQEKLRCEKILKTVRKRLVNAPVGMLRITKNGEGYLQYYVRNSSLERSGQYLRKENHELARRLAQKEYDEALQEYAVDMLKQVNELLELMESRSLDQVYDGFPLDYKHLIHPIRPTDQMALEEWMSFEYSGLPFNPGGPEYYTSTGERMRSKSEVLLAERLHSYGIPYRYECPLYLEGMGTIYPDFTILDLQNRRELYWEHFGMLDDSEYLYKANKKINAYILNDIFPGDRLIMTGETGQQPLNTLVVDRLLEHYFGVK